MVCCCQNIQYQRKLPYSRKYKIVNCKILLYEENQIRWMGNFDGINVYQCADFDQL